MILFGYAHVYIQLMYYAYLSVCTYTTDLHVMGKYPMVLYNIPLILI